MSLNAEKHMTLKRAYALLAVNQNSDIALIKQSYRRAARLYHPDVRSGLSDTDMFNNIVSAFNLIVEEKKNAKSGLSSSGIKPEKQEVKTPSRKQRWTRFTQSTKFRFINIFRYLKPRRPKKSSARKKRSGGSINIGATSLLSFGELVIRFDNAPSIWVRIEAAHAIYYKFRDKFESFAISRLPKSEGNMQIELIRVLGRTGTYKALGAIADHLASQNVNVCCAAFMALESAGLLGHNILDRSLNTPSAFTYYLTSIFSGTRLEKKVLRSRLVSAKNLRRLSAVKRKTGAPLTELLEGVGVSFSGLA